MKLRRLAEADISQVAEWNVQLHEDEKSSPMSVDKARERLLRWVRDQTFKGAIFTIDDNDIGYIIYEDRPVHPDLRENHSVYVRQFFIDREARRSKLGTRAFKAFIEKLVPPGVTVTLNVKSSNPAGHIFWNSLGFEAENISYILNQ